MSVVIIGAGTVGCHIARTLSSRERNVILIEKDPERLEAAVQTMDVAARLGDGGDWQLLDELVELAPTHLMALSSHDELNLVAATIGKHLGYPCTVARVKDHRYLNPTRLDFGRLFAVDHFVGPEWLAAQEIARTVMAPGAIHSELFAHGVVHLRTVKVPDTWRFGQQTLAKLELPAGMMIGLIRRKEGTAWRVIFPHGGDVLLPGDEVTVIGEVDVVSRVHEFLGQERKQLKGVSIVGGTLTGVQLARTLLAHGVKVRVIDSSHTTCMRLAEQIPQATILHHDATDADFLRAERVGQGQAFVACTRHDELNLLACSLAREVGCQSAIAVVSDLRYSSLMDQLDVAQVVSPRMMAAARILSIVGSGAVSSMSSLYENQAEILEVRISHESRFVGIPLSELGPRLPKDFLIAVIQNRGRVMIADGSRVLSPGDTIIVITHPRHIDEFQGIF